MTFSLCFSYVNARHFRTPIEIWGNFVPGMIFFQSIFGYLVFCIVYKWSIDWYAIGEQPPSLLNMLIYMFLSPGTVEEPLYSGQSGLQVVLVLLAAVQVPIMLLLKPFYLRWEHNKARAQGYRGIGENEHITHFNDDEDDEEAHGSGTPANGRPSFADSDMNGGAVITQNIGEGDHEFEFSEVMIHQIIHTIGARPSPSLLPPPPPPLTPSPAAQNSASTASRIRPRICAFGPSHWPTSSSPSCCGT